MSKGAGKGRTQASSQQMLAVEVATPSALDRWRALVVDGEAMPEYLQRGIEQAFAEEAGAPPARLTEIRMASQLDNESWMAQFSYDTGVLTIRDPATLSARTLSTLAHSDLAYAYGRVVAHEIGHAHYFSRVAMGSNLTFAREDFWRAHGVQTNEAMCLRTSRAWERELKVYRDAHHYSGPSAGRPKLPYKLTSVSEWWAVNYELYRFPHGGKLGYPRPGMPSTEAHRMFEELGL